jgi:phosphate-selective porin OprO and OprP
MRNGSLFALRATITVASLVTGIGIGSSAHAETRTQRFDDLWSHFRLYTASDTFVRSVQLSGRFQVDQAYVDSGNEEHSETNLRRMRLGVKVAFLEHFLLHAEAEYDPQDGEPVYQRLTDAYVAWSPSNALELTIGKHGAPFTMDGMTSSKELLAIDRSNLANNIWFTEEYIPGISVAGELGKITYHAGRFSSGDIDRGFGDSNGGEFFLGTIGYDFASMFGAKKAQLNFNYVDNEPHPSNGFTRPLEQVVSVNFDFETERWGVRADLSTAQGYLGQSDLLGFMLMPYYNLRNSNQLVWRYTYVDSDDPNGVRFGRYEREIENRRGDNYREFYFGINHYWYGHRLKLQSGLQYADMTDRAGDGGAYTGWSWTTGFRISW